ncbi:hypothetical protein KP509_18G012200 [Ceratopteris richardii]|uniref:Glutaredoxin domain-containing protein n=1 Tax=Ceratopteris richardii TaxID=49495 RepID=A0A8T2SPP9_CERRI|nr:hypothetical protein KP509_18G012200 [Ceratopteris richardii]
MQDMSQSTAVRAPNEPSTEKLFRLACDNAVVIFTLSSCYMCHALCSLLYTLGVKPTVHEIDDDTELQESLISLSSNTDIKRASGTNELLDHTYSFRSWSTATSSSSQPSSSLSFPKYSFYSPNLNVPAVFVGGMLLGGLQEVMSAHINGSLIPLLKDAGALWL